jgi:FkbM family methyltransferase
LLARIERKLAEVQRWVDSVDGVADWPAAVALSIYRTRPAEGRGTVARLSRGLLPHIWVRPADLHGLSIRMSPAEMADFVIYEEVFIEHAYGLDRVRFVPDAIVDCGAFHGYFSLLAAARFRGVPIVAFEPNARNLEALTANVRINNLPIDIQPAAVSTQNGTTRFSGGGCGGHVDPSADDGAVVKVVDLRGILAGLRSERLLLKLDIEGEEAAVLPAVLPVLPRRTAIFFEWHHGTEAFDAIAGQLTAQGLVTMVTGVKEIDGKTFIDAFAQRD